MNKKYYGGIYEMAGTGWDSSNADLRALGWTVKAFDNSKECDKFVLDNSGRILSERDVKVIIGCGKWVIDENGILDNESEHPDDLFEDVILSMVDYVNNYAFENNISLTGKIASTEIEFDSLFESAVPRICMRDKFIESKYADRIFKKYGASYWKKRMDSCTKTAIRKLNKQWNKI